MCAANVKIHHFNVLKNQGTGNNIKYEQTFFSTKDPVKLTFKCGYLLFQKFIRSHNTFLIYIYSSEIIEKVKTKSQTTDNMCSNQHMT